MTAPSPSRRRRQLAAIHAAKRELRLDDDTYRDLLERLTGARSAAELDEAGLDAVLDHMARLGWHGGQGKRRRRNPSIKSDQARLAAHKSAGAGPQEALILSLWDELAEAGAFRSGRTARLDTFIGRVVGQTLSHPRFLRPDQAVKVIEGLRGWLRRERRRARDH